MYNIMYYMYLRISISGVVRSGRERIVGVMCGWPNIGQGMGMN